MQKKSRTSLGQEALALHKRTGGKIQTKGKISLKLKKNLSLAYTPGVGAVSEHLSAHPEDARIMSIKKNSVAVISDGSAVLGLGNIGPYGALPVMEGKALIFKEFADVDAWPLVLDTQDPDEIVRTIVALAPNFGGINLEDIKAPECFDIERRLIDALDIPVMHDDQHGTAIVVLAGLLNASKVVRKQFSKLKIVISGAGAAGSATAKLLIAAGATNILVLDREGIISKKRASLNDSKKELASLTNREGREGSLTDALVGADVFIGVSGPAIATAEMIRTMAPRAIVFALSNPVPEILPDEAKKGGAVVVATGRSDFPNQVNNALVFPGMFRGALDKKVRKFNEETKLRAAKALASLVKNPTANAIIPDIFDKRVVGTIAKAVR